MSTLDEGRQKENIILIEKPKNVDVYLFIITIFTIVYVD